VDDEYSNYPTFLSSPDGDYEDHAYTGPQEENGLSFQDALGGSYRVLRIVAPAGAKEASLRLRFASGDWKLLAYKTYDKGSEAGMLNPEVGLHISPMMPGRGKGTEATFVLPPECVNLESTVRFSPAEAAFARFDCVAGPQTASTYQSPESITRVEILTRPMRSVVIADLPLMPDSKAIYVPRHFLPEGMVSADNGIARVPNGSTLAIDNLGGAKSRPARNWDWKGRPVVFDKPSEESLWSSVPQPKDPNKRMIRLWIRKQRSGSADPQELYDGEGWPLFRSLVTEFFPHEEFKGFYTVLDRSIHRMDIEAPIAIGSYRTLLRVERGRKDGGSWSFEERNGKGVLRVEYPLDNADKLAGMDVSQVALDSKGKPVTRPDGGLDSQWSAGWVEFDLPRAAAARVAAVEIRARPYTWIQFANVAMDPDSGLAAR
jgi:hypothetical protein